MPRNAFLMIACSLILPGCKKERPDTAHDYFSFANSGQFVTEHLELDLDADFGRQELRGTATLHMRGLDSGSAEVILDTRSLGIEAVTVTPPGGDPIPAAFRLGPSEAIRGEPLFITLPPGIDTEGRFQLQIAYHTSPDASALMWLPPELTAGGSHPFLFSQSQSIHARSWIPLQDTPSVRITYGATIRTPPDLLALMSAENDPGAPRNGEYRFEMPQPIPSYLLALAVGNVFFTPIGPETGIYAEPEVLEAAAFEFADTQDMLDTAAGIYGAYQWGRYDLLILPPSFPYGGMENPRLSFITPSVIAGDRSLVSMIAHELAHSWSGNLVSNATWRDLWLNEGTTSYLTARLMEVLYGRDRADEERVLAYEELLLDFRDVVPAMQALAPDFQTGDPDDSQGSVHYHKGELFLVRLEKTFGREIFDRFLADYFRHFEFQAITTEQFLEYLDENLLRRHPGKYTREQAGLWLYEPGLPADAVLPASTTLDEAGRLARAWYDGEVQAEALPLQDWSPQAVVQFINSLPLDIADERLADLDRALGFSTTTNAEIGRTWFAQVAARRHQAAYPQMEAYLQRYGRTRLIEPVYRALADNGADAALARKVFADSQSGYHPLTMTKIQSVLR